MSETSKFTEEILTAAKEKAQAVIGEAEGATQKALQESKKQAARDSESLLSNAKAEAEGVKRRRISEARHRVKLQEQVEKSRILSAVLDEVKARVNATTKDESNYFTYLAKVISSGIQEIGLDTVVVHLNSIDLNRLDLNKLEREVAKVLGKTVRMEFSKEPVMTSGGAIVSSSDGKTRIVGTLDQNFEAMESKLLIEAGKILFKE